MSARTQARRPARPPINGPARRCVATGAVGARAELVRFALGPDGAVVPDLAARLPGRGVWVAARREAAARAATRNLFARGLGASATVGEDLAGRVEALLARHALGLVGLARRAGALAVGLEAVRALLAKGEAGLVLFAADGAPASRARIEAMAGATPVVALFSALELGRAVGRESAVNIAVRRGGMARRIGEESGRLAGFRRLGEDARFGETRA
ncbi:MAG: DUF448 domain-containing protein [Alphaproteobacteria bacterium]